MSDPKSWQNASLVARFFRYTEQPAHGSACWKWIGAKAPHGYGILGGSANGKRYGKRAHILSWEIHHGRDFPRNLMGCHTCDNPWCVNPEHIFPGTMKDNMSDAARKNRVEFGERHHNAKLNENIVREIRALHASGMCYADIAAKTGVPKNNVGQIVRRIRWRRVG